MENCKNNKNIYEQFMDEIVFPTIVAGTLAAGLCIMYKLGKNAGMNHSAKAFTMWLETYMPEQAGTIYKFMMEHPESLMWK